MKMAWLGILLAVAAGANANVYADELPAPAPVPESALDAEPINPAPVANEHGDSTVSADEQCGKSCWQKFKDWACYRPCHLAPCGDCHRFAPPTPPLYTYFLYPPCKEGCGGRHCKVGCADGHCRGSVKDGDPLSHIGLVGATTTEK